MKAIVYTKYGPPDVLQLQEIEKPTPKENQVLVKVVAASINALETRRFETQSIIGQLMEKALLKGVGKVLGADIAGRVEAVGSAVTLFKPGDEVFGVASGSMGGFAEYACANTKSLVLKPFNVSFEQAATVPIAALTALQGLRNTGQIQSGQKVLINGASGGIGMFAIQLAKSFGAEVTAVCSTRNLEMARSIGADHVIDYKREDFTKNGQQYDLIAAVNGYHPLLDYRRALNPNGVYVFLGGSLSQIFEGMFLAPLVSKIGSKKMISMGITKINQPDLVFMAELLEAGKVIPIIDRCYPLSETAEAFKYLLKEHAKTKVVITMPQ
jgi:NADPH:quinone reductase-like Zn-dependent oxidoreductase